jgi:hypothetical protein
MRTPWPRFALVVVLAGLAGCRSKVVENTAPPEDKITHLADKVDVSLADWLKKPRAELAKMADEYALTVDKLQTATRTNIDNVDLLPQLHAPVRVPVYDKCRFSAAAGFSLPPYLKEGGHDAAVALHLARHGDHDAALALADPNDKDLRDRIEAQRTEKDYPLEWTRAVALALQAGQFKMAHGDPEGATELIQLHKQLREVLDAKAAKGPLGAALLGTGRQALTLAAPAWKAPKVNKSGLAGDVEAALKDWGDVPDPVAGLAAGAGRAEVSALFGQPAAAGKDGRPGACALTAATPDAVTRALDLLALPVPPEGVNAVVAFMDGKDKFEGVLVAYRTKIEEAFPEPAHLALHLLDHGYAPGTADTPAGPRRQVYEGGGLAYDVTMLRRGNAGGALLRVAPAGHAEDGATTFALNPRDWGAVHLDRSFEANRVNLNPAAAGGVVKLTKEASLRRIEQPVAEHVPAAADVTRELSQDLVSTLSLQWPAELSHDSVHHLAVALLAAFGPGKFESREEAEGGHLLWTWEGENTRIKLRLPYDEQAPELVVEDARGGKDLVARAEAARQFDARERRERLAAGKPQTRLPRWLRVNSARSNGLQAEGLHLGMTREETQATLPNSSALRRMPLKDGFNLLFTGEPPAETPYWARQMFIRFGPDDRVAEVRIRYQVGRGPALVEALQATAGAPEELAGPWGGLWTDLGAARKPPVLHRWRDDQTVLTIQRDAGGAEVTLRDCPPDHGDGAPLAPLQFCARGVEGCSLGEERLEILKRYGGKQPPTTATGAEVLSAPADAPYDVLLVWYDQGRVSRIIARHRAGHPAVASEQAAAAAIVAAWAADVDRLGYPRRTEGQSGQVLGAYSWHDDLTRVRTFAQDTEQGVKLFTEFRNWPVPPTAVASGK